MAYDFATMTFMLSHAHDIAVSKITKFQARMKNLHRLGWPLDFQSTKGKASQYSEGDFVDMGLAVELMQLGLAPERMVHVLGMNRWPTLMACRIAADHLAANPYEWLQQVPTEMADEAFSKSPFAMFVYFDPTALRDLSISALEGLQAGTDGNSDEQDQAAASFFYGGGALVSDLIMSWNSRSTRLSLVNISAMLNNLALNRFEEGDERDIEYRRKFFGAISQWASEELLKIEDPKAAEEAYVMNIIQLHHVQSPDDVVKLTGIDKERANEIVTRWIEEVADGKRP